MLIVTSNCKINVLLLKVIPGNFIFLPKVSLPFLSHSISPLSIALGDKAYNTPTLLRDKVPKRQGVFLAECIAFFSPIIIWRAASQLVSAPIRENGFHLLLCWRLSWALRIKSNMKLSIINPFTHRLILSLGDCSIEARVLNRKENEGYS